MCFVFVLYYLYVFFYFIYKVHRVYIYAVAFILQYTLDKTILFYQFSTVSQLIFEKINV